MALRAAPLTSATLGADTTPPIPKVAKGKTIHDQPIPSARTCV